MSTTTLPRHMPGPIDFRDAAGRRQIAEPVDQDYSPLRPATRQTLAPHHWADRHLPAGPEERTGRIDPAAVLAEAAPQTPDPANDKAAVPVVTA